MFRNILQLYSLLVCFVSIIILLITLVAIINKITDLTLTEYKYNVHLIKFSSNENYIKSLQAEDKKPSDKLSSLTTQEINEKRMAARKDYLESVKGDAIYNLIDYASWLIVSLIFFIIHWKLYNNSASSDSA